MSDTLMSTYARLPVTFSHGEGVWLWDTAGNRYLDALSGIAVCGLGHAHPAVTRAVSEQAARLVHTSNLYRVEAQEQLGERLAGISGMQRVFFANSGAEANEAAIKLARLYGKRRGIRDAAIVVMDNAFHGRTLATLSATGNRKVHAGFEPLVNGFIRAPYNDLDALRSIAGNSANVVAVLVEPVQGEAGIVVPDADYLRGVREICDQHGWLMMLDEIQTGMGRSGKWFAFQHAGITPDVMTLAKGLANGVPIGACLAHGEAATLMQPGNHGSTFGGNPLACSAALAVLDTIERDGLLDNCTRAALALRERFDRQLGGLAGVAEVRSLGLLLGIELRTPCAELVTKALDAGLLLNVTADKVVRLLPPLIVDHDEQEQIADQVVRLITAFTGNTNASAA